MKSLGALEEVSVSTRHTRHTDRITDESQVKRVSGRSDNERQGRHSKRRPPVRGPAPKTCDLCASETAKVERRGLCWACYRKLRDAGLPLPLRLCDRPSDPLAAWAHMLALPQARRVLAALAARIAKPRRRPREFVDVGQQTLGGVL
jgi:hypothetical protein